MLPNIRIGLGYDIHPFKDGRPMVLGGVSFDTPYGLDGHSDADVLTHAICDALLGAAGLPDIGHYFPNTDPKYKGIDSQELLADVCETLADQGWTIVNIDSALIAEKPKIYPRVEEMKTRLAASAGISQAQIGIKATTNEKLGSLGRAEGIAAHATALICKT
ncbi:2-C-methyl-D-erythritol 2,4-cyclodiphosphate synthase [Pelagicoccus sp. SDUM812003]|uniref:2-C-methyl-D-erythritol 2,4-cyclodiphosphate synthase n=1 Tax=Pelagicoccus sp. SDUM812003 TaxID=3041267 RepID=UPI002810380B|nr:2-C-methyl-D-erythritol 2,4-cyclodiphosphate synthase [Pelagicoccus sp. SDUM812003]MDQ8203014.1 2-C-methyl-D-erythritol 2,4-cyclodiphosphate synthase [Pelagicoccus sp. SDUM812003]